MLTPTASNLRLARLLQFAAELRSAADSSAQQVQAPAPDPGSEPQDLKGLRRLDPEAITRIHNRYFPMVYRYARFRLSDEGLAEDVAAEAFTRLLEYSHAGKGPHDSVRGWLMRTTSNLVNDFYRLHYTRTTEDLSEHLPTELPDPPALAELQEEKNALYRALTMLTVEQQHVLALRFGSGFSLAETADALGKKANAIKALQFRAIAALRREMGVVGD
jgi:RNA polymerase sigma-70 factor (ECF subfamily)